MHGLEASRSIIITKSGSRLGKVKHKQTKNRKINLSKLLKFIRHMFALQLNE